MQLQCPVCGSDFEKRTYQQRYCSDGCRSKGKAAAQKAARRVSRQTICLVCGVDITHLNANARYCSERHANEARAARGAPADAPRCSIDDCGEPAVARGWCHHHWYGWRVYGDPLAAKRHGPQLPLEQRLWAGVDAAGECWVWTKAASEKGYGKIGDGPRVRSTHVVSWELAHGPVPEGLCVLHRCDNPPCVRPSHLFLGTLDDNNQDMISKGRAAWQKPKQALT